MLDKIVQALRAAGLQAEVVPMVSGQYYSPDEHGYRYSAVKVAPVPFDGLRAAEQAVKAATRHRAVDVRRECQYPIGGWWYIATADDAARAKAATAARAAFMEAFWQALHNAPARDAAAQDAALEAGRRAVEALTA